ncbi:MAG: glycosyltransferase family 4 protein [Thaumarchaeota archaeon]|nr:glycosyltransferase family 4 protein [Nitrososphaerota archaeon]
MKAEAIPNLGDPDLLEHENSEYRHKLTILSVTPFFLPVIGGVESVVYESSIGMRKKGHRPIILTGSFSDRVGSEIIEGVEVIRANQLDVPENGVIDPSNFDFKAPGKLLSKIVEEKQVDVIHLHNYQMKQYAMFLFSFLKEVDLSRIPVVITIHNSTDDDFAHYLFSYLPFSKVIVLTSKSAFDLIKGGVPAGKIHALPNMIDTLKFTMADGQVIRRKMGFGKEPILLFPSRLVGREGVSFKNQSGKGLHTLLRALHLIKREIPDVKLLLMGNDPVYPEKVRKFKEDLAQMASTLGAEDSIRFLDGAIPQNQIPDLFSAADVVVSLGVTECFGMVFLEGMAAGKPVVGVNSAENGVAEVVKDGYSGILVPPNDPLSTANAIIRLLSDNNLAHTMGNQAVKWVKDNYDVDVVVPRLIDLYRQCIRELKESPHTTIDHPQGTVDHPHGTVDQGRNLASPPV